LKDLSSP